ncbi:SH3 domain-containing protein [Terrimonas rubra]|uniref:SH3 domain-containing protein n=1 Tax=Terrimonas rubra TaxID=1035890 RepID=A0ABW6A4Z2_9BACT
MKTFITVLLPLLLTVAARTQTTDFTKWLKKKTVDGKEITMLRVPETEFGPKLLGFISLAQHELNRLPDLYRLSFNHMSGDSYKEIEGYCQKIEMENASFPVHYYRDEMKAFKALKEEMDQKELARKKAAEEKEFFAKLKADFAWVSGDTLMVRSRPEAKSPGIGKIHRLSYIRAYEVEDKEDWVQIDFGGHSGYVLRDDIAIDWEELEPSKEDSMTLQRGRYYDFTPTAAYTAQLKKAAAEEERAMRAANAAPRRKYYTGPRGGCYFINSNGNKQYVDRSYCR